MKRKDRSPWSHQMTTTEFLIRNKRAYVFNEKRTGKTLSAAWAIDILIEFRKIKRALIVCTLTNIELVWMPELFENFPHRKVAIAHGSREKRLEAINGDAEIVIINHDGVKNYLHELRQAQFDLCVIDETTAFKNPSSDRSKAMKRLSDELKVVWGMTGDPRPNGPSEVFGQARIINPYNLYLPRFYGRFRDMVEQQVAPYIWQEKPEANEYLKLVLQPSIRFTRDECFDIPPMVHNPIMLPMSEQQKEAYDKMRKELYLQFDGGEINASNAGVKASKLLQISAGMAYTDAGTVVWLDDKPKFDYLLQLFEEAGRKKLIVASAFKASVEKLHERFTVQGIESNYVHGGVSVRHRTEIVNAFQNGSLQILVVQPNALAHGVCLDATNTIAWHSLVPSGEIYSQFMDRIVSSRQTRKQYNEYLLCSQADTHMFDIVTGKSAKSGEMLKLFTERLI